MNPNPDEQLLARWLDGEMDTDERASFDARLKTDPALRAEAEVLQSLRAAFQEGFPRIAEELALPLQVGAGTRHFASETEAPRQFLSLERCLTGLSFDPG